MRFSGGANMSGMSFSTSDNDNDNHGSRNCASTYRGGWWYNRCCQVHLNGINYATQMPGQTESFRWYPGGSRGDSQKSFQQTKMKIRKFVPLEEVISNIATEAKLSKNNINMKIKELTAKDAQFEQCQSDMTESLDQITSILGNVMALYLPFITRKTMFSKME